MTITPVASAPALACSATLAVSVLGWRRRPRNKEACA
jgi:hypothetical protein